MGTKTSRVSKFLQHCIGVGWSLSLLGCGALAPFDDGSKTVVSTVVASVPAGSFLEGVAEGPDGALYVTDLTLKKIWRYSDKGGLTTFATIDAHPIGIEFDSDGTLYVTAQEKSLFGGGGSLANGDLIYAGSLREAPTRMLKVEGAHFLNGMTFLAPGRLLIADSRGGVIWELDTKQRRASRFIEHSLLDARDPSAPAPAANGIKVHGGFVYVSNSARGTIYRVPLDAQLRPIPGRLEAYANVAADDFAFSPDGTLYFTTHEDFVKKVDAEGNVSMFAGPETGITGNTALIWKRDGTGPYVIGDGGFFFKQWLGKSQAGPATIVRFGKSN